MRLISLIALANGLMLTAIFLLTGCSSNDTSSGRENPAVPVTTLHPEVRDITIYIESIGSLLPEISMEIRPQVNGTLKKVFASEGEWVKDGAPLFLVDTTIYEIKVLEAKAQHAIDAATLQAAEKKLARFQDLADKDLMAQTEWDDLLAQAAKAKAGVELAEARLAEAQIDLDRCTIRSPISGRLGKLDAHPGLLISAGQSAPLAAVVKIDPLIVEFTLTEQEYPKIPRGANKIEVHSLCSNELCSHGLITFFDNSFDKKTGQLLVRGRIDNQDHQMRPGQSLRVRIPIETISHAILIPNKAIRLNQDGPYVFVVQPDKTAEQRQLTLGSEHGESSIVLEGLKPDDEVVLEGHLRLTAGRKVDVKS